MHQVQHHPGPQDRGVCRRWGGGAEEHDVQTGPAEDRMQEGGRVCGHMHLSITAKSVKAAWDQLRLRVHFRLS